MPDIKVKLPCPYPPVTLIGKIEAGKSSVENAHPPNYRFEWLPGKLELFSTGGVLRYSIWVTNGNDAGQMV
jgi:hypothetical protein